MTLGVRPPLQQAGAKAASRKATILVVDDHRPNLLALEAALSPLGERLEHATSGEEALRLLQETDFAVALLDVRMPGLSGIEVAARLRELQILTPIIFLTADQGSLDARAHGYDQGAVDFILKPFDPHVLRAKVRVFVELQKKRAEVEALSSMYAAERLVARKRVQTLAMVADKLSRWLTREEVARFVATEAHDALRARTSEVYMRSAGEGELELLAGGGADVDATSPPRLMKADAAHPVARAVRSGQAVWVETRDDLLAEFPGLAIASEVFALVALPLRVEDQPVGAISFGFDAPRKWDTAERELYLTLTAQILAALERARLLGNERQAHQALWKQTAAARLMADVGTLLSSSLDYEAVLRQLTELLVPVVADWCAVDVLDQSGHIQRLSAFHADPAKRATAQDLERRYPGDPDAVQGVPNVLRTGQTEWVMDIPDSLLESAAKDEEHLRIIRQLGLRSYVVVPLRARGRILGALSLIYAESGRQYTADEVRFVEQLAERAALSVDNALLFKQQVDARERLERQSRQAMLVGDVGAALTRSETLNEALQRCAEAVVRHLEAAFARIWTTNSRESVLELQASAGLYTHVDGPHRRVPIGQYKIGRIAQQGTPHLTNDVQQDPWVGDRDWARREGMVSFAGYPLIIEGKVIGVMAMFARRPLADDTITSLSAVADTIAIGIERSRADKRAREERDTLEVVNEVGRALAAELDRERLVQAITDSATKLAGAAFGAFFYDVADTSVEPYTLYAISGVSREAFSRFPLPRNTKVFAPTFAGQGIVRVDDIRKDPRYGQNPPYLGMPEGHLPVASYLAVPVISRTGAVIGGLFFGHPEPAVFSERSQMLVSGVAAQAATAMDNARLFRDAQRLISQLDKSNKELDQFAYVASHDLKAPLRGISNLSQWIEEDLADVITPDGKEQLTLLRSRVSRMEGLINGILDYSRAGRVRTKIEPVYVDKLLSEVVELSAAPDGAAIQVQPGMPELRTERTPLQQVFLNLVGNALKHAKRSDPQVHVRFKDTGDAFEFSVADNGPGIAPEYHERIWQIFQTLEPRDTVEGTGVGLSVVKKLVENKGGRAWLESSLGSGATFYFTWPKSEREAMKSV